jgi:hypothetical protein
MVNFHWPWWLLLAAFCAAAGAAADEPLAGIPVHKQSGINYVSSGMSEAERKEMQRIANKYPMQLVFIAGDNQAPIKGVKVTVKDLKGSPQIEALSDCPYFFFTPPLGPLDHGRRVHRRGGIAHGRPDRSALHDAGVQVQGGIGLARIFHQAAHDRKQRHSSQRSRDACHANHFGFGATRFLARSGRPSRAWGRFPAGAGWGGSGPQRTGSQLARRGPCAPSRTTLRETESGASGQ